MDQDSNENNCQQPLVNEGQAMAETGECSSEDEIEYLPIEGSALTFPLPAPLYKPELSNSMGTDDIADGNNLLFPANAIDAKINSNLKAESYNLQDSHSWNIHDQHDMKNMGLPRNFANRQGEEITQDYKMETTLPPNYFTGATSYQDQQIVRKGQKETFYCEFCMIELNSRDTLLSHTKGQKHIRKEEQHDQEVRRGKNRGYYVEDKKVKSIANPLPLQKKVPVRLNEKLRETTTAIVGLNSIHEIIACSNAEVEPYYECTLCGQQGEANAMFQHLQGKPHRAKFLQDQYPDNRKYIDGTLNQGFLEKEIERLDLRENTELQKINTMYSDEMFPWTAGKAPWSVEQGGTGIVPTRARNKVGLITQNLPKPGNNSREGEKTLKSFRDIDPYKLDMKIESDGDRKLACTIVQKMSEKIRDYSIEHGKHDPFQMEMLFNQIDAIMEVVSLKDAKSDGDNAERARNTPPTMINPVKQEISPRDNDHKRQRSRDREYDNVDRRESSKYASRGSRNGRDDSRERDYKYEDRDRHQSSRMDYEKRY